MRNRFISLLAVLAMAIGMHAAVSTGTCGANLTWSYDTSTGVLTISGSGDMPNYGSEKYYTDVPWYSIQGDITQVSLPADLTSIGDNAFRSCTKLRTIWPPPYS